MRIETKDGILSIQTVFGEAICERHLTSGSGLLTNQRYDTEIAQMQEKQPTIEKRQKLDTQTTGAQRDIKSAIRQIVTGEKTDDFCGQLLDRMTVYADGRVEAALKLLPSRWFFLLEGVRKFRSQIGEQQHSELPTEDMGGGDIAKFLDEQMKLQYCIFEKNCFLQKESSFGKSEQVAFSLTVCSCMLPVRITVAKPT